MTLSFRKSVLLFSAVALGGMLGANAQDNVIVEGYTFEQEWKSESVPTSQDILFTDYRQGFGQNNQFYIQNKMQNVDLNIFQDLQYMHIVINMVYGKKK